MQNAANSLSKPSALTRSGPTPLFATADDLDGFVMSGRRPLIKGYFRHCAGRGCGHVFGLLRGE